MTNTILVTGGSGYLAGFLICDLIADGWSVRTTVRSLAREAEVRGWLKTDDARLSFHAADLGSDAGWAEAASGCSHVAHVASPFPSSYVKNADDLIVPARDGALRVLRAAREAGAKRVVMTSSAAAIAYGHRGQKTRFTEADWTDVASPDAYAYVQSKTIAERAARDWVAAEGGGLEFATVNPSLIAGPLLSADTAASVELVKKLLSGALPGCPDFGFGLVDVRDVADLHRRVLTAPDMAGERFIASGPFLKVIDVAHMLKAAMGSEARKVPTRRLPDWLVRIFALFDPAVRQVTGELGNIREMDASHSRAVLGWVPRPPEETVTACARSLIDLGIVKV